VAAGAVNSGTVIVTNNSVTPSVVVATGTVNHTPVHITGPSGGKYTYSCTTAGYTLNPATPTKGTSSTAAGYSCDQQTYNYSCPTGSTLSGPTSGTSSSGSGSSCSTIPAYAYSCAAGFTLSGSSTGTTSTAPGGTTCTQQIYNYSCPTGYTLSGPTSGTSSGGTGTHLHEPGLTRIPAPRVSP